MQERDRRTDGKTEEIRTRPEERVAEPPDRKGGRGYPKRRRDRDRHRGRDTHTDRPEGSREGEREKRAEAGAAGSGGHGAGAAERAGAGSRLVKAARSGEIAARIAELHKTPPARPAAAPAPISSLIAARAGYAFKCYLIGLRRSWGPERPPPPPRMLRTPALLASSANLFSKSQIAAQPLPTRSLHPASGLPFVSGLLLLLSPPQQARGHSERHKSPEDA